MSKKFVYTEKVTGEIVQIPIELLHHHHDNPRKELGDLAELTDSIKAKGVLQNLTVVPYWFKTTGVGCDDPEEQAKMGYLVVIGNRRFEAAKAAGLKTLPCVIAKMTPAEQVQTMLLENIQRSDLTAYEQAKGFQMMLDLGDTVDGIVQKTGFSKSTVNRRLKLAELDEEKFKETEGRQITLDDYLKLSEIDDPDERNKLLGFLGTANFDWKFRESLTNQRIAKLMEPIKPLLREKGITKLKGSEWNYNRLRSEKISDVTPAFFDFDGETRKLFYDVSTYNETITIYAVSEKQEKVEDLNEKEIRQRCEKAEEDMKALNQAAYCLRKNFVANLNLTSKNSPLVLRGAIIGHYLSSDYYTPETVNLFDEAFPPSEGELPTEKVYGAERIRRFIAKFLDKPAKAPLFAYMLFKDSESKGYNSTYWFAGKRVPVHSGNSFYIDHLYDWLISLGYEMSDDEKALRDGTHEIFHRFDAELAAQNEREVDDEDDDEDYDDDIEDDRLGEADDSDEE